MKALFLRHRRRLLFAGILIALHQILLWALAGHDVTAVFLAPHENTPVHWAILAGFLLLLRFYLLLILPGWLMWKLTQPRFIRRIPGQPG